MARDGILRRSGHVQTTGPPLRSLRLGSNMRVRGVSSAGRAPALQAGGHRFDPGTLHLDFAAISARHRSSTPAPSASVAAGWQQTAALLARGLGLGSGLNVGLGGGAESVLEHPVARLVALRLRSERT
jgi:hypothetical protein